MNRLWLYWNSLSPQDRTGIIIGVAVTVLGGIILAALGSLGKLSLTGFKHLFGKSSPVQPLPPPPQPITIKLEPSQLVSPVQLSQEVLAEKKKPAAFPEIPRTPAVGFVARRDREGRDILTQLKEKLAPQNNQLIVLWGPGNLAAQSLGALRLIKTTESGKRLLVEGLTRQMAKARLPRDDHADEFAKRFVIYFRSYSEAHSETTPEDFEALETEKVSLRRKASHTHWGEGHAPARVCGVQLW